MPLARFCQDKIPNHDVSLDFSGKALLSISPACRLMDPGVDDVIDQSMDCWRHLRIASNLLGSGDLVLNFNSTESTMDGVHELRTTPGRAATVKRRIYDILWARQVRRPIQLEFFRDQLRVGTAVPVSPVRSLTLPASSNVLLIYSMYITGAFQWVNLVFLALSIVGVHY